MKDKRLERYMRRLALSQDAVVNRLKIILPEGIPVQVKLRYGQYRMTNAIVISHDGGTSGCLRVRLTDTPKQDVKSIPIHDVEKRP